MKFFSRVVRRVRSPGFVQAFAILCGLHLAEAQEFQITDTSIDGLGRFTVSHVAAADSYYLLYRGDSPTNFPQVAALKLGQDGFGQLTDPATVNNVTAAFYRVLRVPLTQSLDVDGDGIPDVYELQHPAFLNPLNPGDASLDYDGDGKSNLQEFRDGTDPAKLPDNPAAVASPIDPSRSTSVADATAFLYAGTNAIQSGVTNGTFDPFRVCILRGRVRQRDGSILTGVTISVLRHPEFGLTKTRADGMFDLAVNGGELLTVIFARPGYCPVQRQLQTPWADYLCLDDVTMMTMDPAATPIAFGTNSPVQVARGSVSTDTDGSRQATLILPSGTCANVVINGTTQSCGALTLRATEFTVGTNGPASMPAGLPPTSGYTYCVELSADEAVAAGASTVQFNQPLCFYVENFLNFPVGQIVPTGYYDRQKGTWVASRNGRVVKVLDVINGAATIDADGDGAADTPAQLAALGITDEELQRVATLYSPGQMLWRTCITHFSPWDLNSPEGPPPGSKSPPSASNGPNQDNSCPAFSSIIEVERQTLGESLAIVGTPYRLHYHSDRARGYLQAYTIRIPLSEDTVPASLKRIDLKIEVAGRLFSQSYPAAPDQYATFTWDGLDAYGRVLSGTFPVSVRVGFVYPATYYPPGQFEQSFAGFPDTTFALNNARTEITLWKDWKGLVGNLLADTVGLGNWTIDVHHAYDPRSRTLHFGNGNRRSATALDLTVISTFAGGAFASANNGDGGPATAARLTIANGLAVAPDGSLYIAEDVGNRVRKVGPDGIITTVAGSVSGQGCISQAAACGDGGPATNALLSSPAGLALAPDGTLYIADRGNHRIRKVSTDGTISTIAGTGVQGFSGDGGPAVQAQLSQPYGVSIAPDGNLYISDSGNSRVRRVSVDGIIITIAGGVIIPGPDVGDGGPALQAELSSPYRVTVGSDGSLYVMDHGQGRIRKIGTDGIISTVAGTGRISSFGGDGGLATLADLFGPTDMAFVSDGSYYVSDTGNVRVRYVGTEGIINTVAGTGVSGFSGDGGPAAQAVLNTPAAVAVAPDGSLYIADYQRVRRVTSALSGFSANDLVMASDDGREIFIFDNSGRHLQTLDALTGAVRYQFSYDAQGHLSSIEDGDHNVTSVERDTQGNATAIVSPYGQQTALTIGIDGYLASVSNPAGESSSFGYSTDGLLTSMTDPRTNAWTFTYDTLGRLAEDLDPAGGFKALSHTDAGAGFSVEMRTTLQRTNRYDVNRLATGTEVRIHTFPNGLQSVAWQNVDGTGTNEFSDGVVESIVMGPDPRWGMLAPIELSTVTTFPQGPTYSTSTRRAVTLSDATDPFSLIRWTETNGINGRFYIRTFDAASRTMTNRTPAGREVVSTFDTLMHPVRKEVAGRAPIQYTYDVNGHITSRVSGTGSQTRTNRYLYDSSGFLTNVIDPMGQSTTLNYDLAGRVTQEILADSRTTQIDFDANGNLTGLTPPGRPVHGFTYSSVNLLTGYLPPVTVPGTPPSQYGYDLDQQLITVTRPDGLITQYDYVGGGCNCDRLNSIVHPRGTNVLTYDPVTGHPVLLATSDGVNLSWIWAGSLLTQEAWTGPVSGSVTYTFDADLFHATRQVNTGAAINYSYDGDKFLTGAAALTLTRNPQNASITGVSVGEIADSRAYNEFGEPTNYVALFGVTPLYAVQYVRDQIGRITTKMETIGGVNSEYDYTYDSVGRLTNVVKDAQLDFNSVYDSNDNALSLVIGGSTRVGSYDTQDRLATLGPTAYTWTLNGELVTKSTGTQTTTFDYDVFGNLLRVILPDATTIDFVVDGLDRRIGRKINGSMVQGFLYERNRVIAELDGNGSVVSEFIYGTQSHVPDYMIKGGQTYRIITDQLGSPRLIVNVADGQIAQRIDYDVLGRIIADSAPGFQPFGFAGGLYDQDTGLVRFGARDYDPDSGRWTAKDPILFGGLQANLYVYVNNDPVNRIDPSGRGGSQCENEKSPPPPKPPPNPPPKTPDKPNDPPPKPQNYSSSSHGDDRDLEDLEIQR